MKNIFRLFHYYLVTVLLLGCSTQQQIMTAAPKQTNTPLPTFIPLPTFTSVPATTETYLFPPLSINIFNPSLEGFYEPASFVENIVKTDYGTFFSGDTIEKEVFADSTQGRVVFSLFWEEGDLDFSLIQPDGQPIDSSTVEVVQYFDYYTTDRISYMSNPGRAKYYLYVPQLGKWKLKIIGKSAPSTGSNYILQVTSMDAIGLHYVINPDDPSSAKDGVEYKFVPLQRSEHFSGNPIVFTFGATDNTSMLAGRQYIHGVSMYITVEDPAKKQYSFELYDDGKNGDGKADDGVYGNVFTNTSIVGTYNICLQISGKNNRAKEPFTREYPFSIVVK